MLRLSIQTPNSNCAVAASGECCVSLADPSVELYEAVFEDVIHVVYHTVLFISATFKDEHPRSTTLEIEDFDVADELMADIRSKLHDCLKSSLNEHD